MKEKIHISYKYRIYPKKDQEATLAQTFGSVRYLYNYFLNYNEVQYEGIVKSEVYK